MRVLLQRAYQDVAFRATDYSPRPLSCGRGRAEGAGEGAFSARLKILFLPLLLAGCASITSPPAPRPVMVQIPIATPIYCNIPVLQQPPLAIAMLTPDSPPADTIRTYVATVDILKSAVVERDTILKGCAAPLAAADSGQPGSAGAVPLPALADGRRPLLGQGEVKKTFAGALLSKLRGLLPW